MGGIELDEKRHAVYANGQNVQLTLKEYELLSFLMAHAGTAFDREQLLSEVWGMDYFGGHAHGGRARANAAAEAR